jgi:hypothetical protein
MTASGEIAAARLDTGFSAAETFGFKPRNDSAD